MNTLLQLTRIGQSVHDCTAGCAGVRCDPDAGVRRFAASLKGRSRCGMPLRFSFRPTRRLQAQQCDVAHGGRTRGKKS